MHYLIDKYYNIDIILYIQNCYLNLKLLNIYN